MKKNIAVVWGGYSSEKEVSQKSANGILSFIDKEKYNLFSVRIEEMSWLVWLEEESLSIDKNDFSFIHNGEKIKFDFVYNTIHGTPGEDGVFQGYLDMLHIPYSNCGVMASALTFNKFICNNFLKSFGLRVASSILLRQHDVVDEEAILEQLGMPVFVKPNVGGSSFATTKVKKESELSHAIKEAFKEANEVIVESFIVGTEVTCGCYKTHEGFVSLPLTEVVPKNEFFDYDAKYKGQVEEITPARVSKDIASEIQESTKNIYHLIGAKGIIRADFIISEGVPYLLEVNTTPGMTGTSFIPQQIAAAGLSIKEVLGDIIEFEYQKAKY